MATSHRPRTIVRSNAPILPANRAQSESRSVMCRNRKAGDAGFDGLQSLDDLRHNWNRLLDAAGLTEEERQDAVRLFNARVATVPGTKV
jgi:hypothetical protein